MNTKQEHTVNEELDNSKDVKQLEKVSILLPLLIVAPVSIATIIAMLNNNIGAKLVAGAGIVSVVSFIGFLIYIVRKVNPVVDRVNEANRVKK